MKGIYTVLLLILSNTFMTIAWYGHLRLNEVSPKFSKLPLIVIILMAWGVALFEYLFQVPANRIGFQGDGGPFNLVQLKVIQEIITLVIFTLFASIVFKIRVLTYNHLIAFILIILAVYFVFKDQ